MPKIKYINKRFHRSVLVTIENANKIIARMKTEGYKLTLRQLYYQFVSADLLPNTLQNYKKLGQAVNDARLAGLIDWDAIEDRTRMLRGINTYDEPSDYVRARASGFVTDKWEEQKQRPEVWIEKDALLGVFERPCNKFFVDYFSCRGYTSQSEVWGAGQRILHRFVHQKQRTVILHFGDHDPSGVDMSRDIEARLDLFTQAHPGAYEIQRIALNMSQVRTHKPPPNPAKITDSRFKSYTDKYGKKCWELDALRPNVLDMMVTANIKKLITNKTGWARKVKEEKDGQRDIVKAADRM